MSDSSARALVEAGILSDHRSVVAGVASLIEQLIQQSEPLNTKRIAQLCKIKVIRHGGRATGHRHRRTRVSRLGNQTWLIGVYELVRDPVPTEQKMIDQAFKALQLPEEKFDWVRFGANGRFVRDCREGDSLIQIWRRRSSMKHPTVVLQSRPVLLKQRTRHWSRFYFDGASGRHSEMSWGKFKKLLKKLGYLKKVGPCITHLLETDMADAIARNWKAAANE
jgi:hypothetical protein